MKRLLFLLITTLTVSSVWAQCPTGNVTLTTQQQVNDFLVNYPNCTQMSGNLEIGDNTDITDLGALGQLTEISGNLSITKNHQLVSLTGLNNLTLVGGNFVIYDNDALPNLNALTELMQVGGHMRISYCPITQLDGLINLTDIGGDLELKVLSIGNVSGLQNLSFVGEDIIFDFTTQLTSVSGLSNITSLAGALRLYDCYNLLNLDGLENITYLGSLGIVECAISSLEGLSGLTSISGSMRVGASPSLNSLEGLENLTSIGGTIFIGGQDNFQDLSGLDNLEFVGGLFITNNDLISSLSPLENAIGNLTGLSMYNNPNLFVCSIPIVCDYLENGGSSNIYNNGLGCNTPTQIIQNCSSCTGDIYLSTQEEVDNFSTNYPNCTVIYGSIFISDTAMGFPITSFNGLNQIEAITGDLVLGENSSVVNVTNFTGLENLTYIGGNLHVESTGLQSFEGLENFTFMGGALNIINNLNLTNLSAIENLDYIGITDLTITTNTNLSICEAIPICNYLTDGGTANIANNAVGCNTQAEVEQICAFVPMCPDGNISFYNQQEVNDFPINYPNCDVIEGNVYIGEDITDLSGLNSITTINGNLQLDYFSTLMDFSGLENLETIGGEFRVEVPFGQVRSFEALESLTTIGGDFIVDSNNDLEDFSGLENLISIGGDFAVTNNYNLVGLTGLEGLSTISGNFLMFLSLELENLSGLNNLVSIGGNFLIDGNGFTSLSGLENLNSIGGELGIWNNSLETLTGLENLNSIGGELKISTNYSLTSLAGIANIDHTTITDLIISNNNFLNICGVTSICNYLAAGGTATISGNALGCATQSEVESVCNSDTDCTSEVSEEISHIFDEDLFIDGVGFTNNSNITFTNSAIPNGAVLSDASLELYFRLNGSSCENEIAIQLTDPAGNTQALTAFATCDGGTGLYYVDLDITNVSASTGVNNWLIEFDDTNDQNADYEYSVRFARLTYTSTTVGNTTIINEVSEIADMDLFIDAVGFANNPNVTFADPGTPTDAVLSDISLELYFRLNGASCENEIAIQITDPAGNTQALTAYTTCDGGNGLFYVNLDVPSGNTTGSVADWIVEFDDTNDQNADYEYSVRFGRLTYTTTQTIDAVGGIPVTVNDQISEDADMDLFIDGVGFANNGTYTFTDPGIPADGVLSNISLELYFRLNGASCENEIAMQLTDPAGNTQPLTAYTTCDGGTGLYYVNLDVPSGNTTGSVADWVLEFDDTNDQNSDYEYSVRFGRLTYDVEYTECVPMLVNENEAPQQLNTPSTQQLVNSSTRQLNNSSLKLYPVPASQHLNVEYFSAMNNPTNIEVISNEGKTLLSTQEFLQEGLNTIQLDIAALPAGHYHIRMYNTDDMQMQSFVKIAP